MAASRVTGYGVTGYAATSTSVATTKTAGVAGDVHVACLDVQNQAAVVTPPAGWGQIGGFVNIGTAPHLSYWWWRDDGVATNPTWSWTGAAVDRSVWVEVFRSVDMLYPVLISSSNTGASSTPATHPGLTALRSGAGVLFVNNDQGFTTTGTFTGWTSRNDTIDQTIYSVAPLSAGATGAFSNALSAAANWAVTMILLQDAISAARPRPFVPRIRASTR